MPVLAVDTTVQGVLDKEADLTAKKAGNLALAKIDLFTNNVNPNELSVLGDFTLPVWTGYVQKAVAGWTANALSVDGQVSTDATNVVSWAGPGDGTGQTVYGYILREAAGGAYIAGARFPAPVGIAAVTDVLNLVATYRTP